MPSYFEYTLQYRWLVSGHGIQISMAEQLALLGRSLQANIEIEASSQSMLGSIAILSFQISSPKLNAVGCID